MFDHRMNKVSIGQDLSTKKLPVSKKYENVKAVTKTGKIVTKAAENWDELNLNVRYRKNEHFRRIRADTLVSLFHAEDDENSPQVLLLDLRPIEEYESCHVRGAVSFPIAMLSRSMNNFIPEILEFCNREPEKIIVLYSLKEKESVTAGNLFFEKGIDNVFVLTKGMNNLIQDKYDGLLVGDVPMPVPSSCSSSLASTRASSRAPSAMGTPRKQVGTPKAMRPYDTKVRIKLLSSSLRKSKPSSWH
ncbi:rhodanese domain-containing protein [Chloropicon roscoffensis]|uniref:Rhodanese domain-containing protein n=1 Tax=Chloropicon roscoffensis TaxID=1461544 RepID=A0AAX4PJ80_9CHLO